MAKQTKIYSEAVSKRFVEAFYTLLGKRIVKNKREFCHSMGMATSSVLKRMEDYPDTFSPTLEQICLVVKKYSVSADWLITGEGEAFK